MYDIKPLEDEWIRYKQKERRPIILGIALLIILAIATVIVLKDKQYLDTIKSYFDTNTTTTKVVTKTPTIKDILLVDEPLGILGDRDKNFIQNSKIKDKPKDNLVDIPLLDGKANLNIVESTSVSAYKDVETRFFQTHNIEDALFLASSYYKRGDYNKAQYWALESNKIDADMEESIFIFVKSKLKLGNKSEAISILVSYIKKSDSEEAKNLLYKIKNNKL